MAIGFILKNTMQISNLQSNKCYLWLWVIMTQQAQNLKKVFAALILFILAEVYHSFIFYRQ